MPENDHEDPGAGGNSNRMRLVKKNLRRNRFAR